MSAAAPKSPALRRIGRAGPNAGEMELLRAATLDVDRAVAAWRRWLADHPLDDAHYLSSDLLPAACANLPADARGPDAERLRGLRRRAWANTRYRMQAIDAAAAVLASMGITPLVVKGASLAVSVYPLSGVRPMADVDLVIGDDRFDEALGALVAAGWYRPRTLESPFDHAMEILDPEGRAVDMHRWVLFPRFAATPERGWFERSSPYPDVPARRLRTSDEFVLAVLHGLLTASPSSVRWPLDVVYLARHGAAAEGLEADAFWSEVVASADEIGAGPVVADAVEMCRVELGAEVALPVVSALAAGRSDPHLRQHWALSRRGVKLQWRMRRYARLCRADGRRPTVRGYLQPRVDAVRSKGLRTTLAVRLDRGREIVEMRRRT